MDPVSTASAIAGLISLSGTIIAQGYSYISTVRHAPQELRLLMGEVAALNELLDHLQNLATTADDNRVTQIFDTFVRSGAISICTELFKSVEKSISTCIQVNGQTKRNAAKSLLWPFKERETKDALQKLDRMKSTLTAAISLDVVSSLRKLDELQKDLSHDLTAITSSQQRQERQELLRWLTPVAVSPEENRKAALELRQADTGMWLLNSSALQQWKQAMNGILWLSGNPGSGKTILATTVIEYLEAIYTSPTIASTYFYCDHKDPAKRSFRNFVTSIVCQLIRQNPLCCSYLESLFEKYHRDQTRNPSIIDLQGLLKSMSCQFEKLFVVLDALDEAEDITSFLNGIEDLRERVAQGEGQDSTIQILMTSRKDLVIERSMLKQEAVHLQVTYKDIQADLAEYIGNQIESRIIEGRLKLRHPRLKDEIASTLIKNANGMFLWVRLQLDRISSLTSDKLIRKALVELPTGLDSTYIRVLQKIQAEFPENVDIVKKILTWLVASRARLSLHELAEAISIEEEDRCRDVDAIATDPKDLLGLCGSLVNIEDNDLDPYVTLIHLSLEEYLKSPQILQSPVATFHVDLGKANSILALRCLQYVGFSDFQQPCFSEGQLTLRLREYRLLKYAAIHWTSHLAKCEPHLANSEDPLWDIAAWFLKPGLRENNFHSWQQACATQKWVTHFDIRYQASTIPDPLYYTILYGLDSIGDWFIQQMIDVNQHFSMGMTPLHIAAWAGRNHTVRKLLERGAQVDSMSVPWQLTPLHLAATMCRHETVKVLLDAGADPNKGSKSRSTPFYRACRGGSIEVVRTLYAAGVNINARTYDNWTPLHEAVENGHPAVVLELLRWGADLDVETDDGYVPLVLAAMMDRHTIYRIIQDHALTERKLDDLIYKLKIQALQKVLCLQRRVIQSFNS